MDIVLSLCVISDEIMNDKGQKLSKTLVMLTILVPNVFFWRESTVNLINE